MYIASTQINEPERKVPTKFRAARKWSIDFDKHTNAKKKGKLLQQIVLKELNIQIE